MSKIEVGQKLFVVSNHRFINREPVLMECEVTKVNRRSVYAQRVSAAHAPGEFRFDKKTLFSDDGWGTCYQAYLNKQDYWDFVNQTEERKALQIELKERIEKMSLNKLRELKERINC
ncbi:hypothetical protein CN449_15295 [Bacillus thuringiensis]|uniref:beta barrel domain-containing protein n=1 Tax=Bacillus thuringiensis TaxID=1428 RepID=UPI000BF70EA4|nr:hypothetical protein [Bacillus thuringiensis]PEW74028.1 hypothetical protein CN449_15295 [Bacillus thuringiensis]